MYEGNWKIKEKLNKAERKKARYDVPVLENGFSQREHSFVESSLILFAQKDVSRWGGEDRSREERTETREMLAEHIAGINMLARIVKERAAREGDESILSLDWEKIDRIIQLHDLAEVIFGDKVTKTSFDEKEEEKAQQEMILEAEKRGMGSWVGSTLNHYWEKDGTTGAKVSPEANFVKTLDEIEGLLQMFHARRLDKNKRGYEAHVDFFNVYANQFPTLNETGQYIVELWRQLYTDPQWSLVDNVNQIDMFADEDKTKTA